MRSGPAGPLSGGALSGFQSTLPVWGATRKIKAAADVIHEFQSTPPVWKATTAASQGRVAAKRFNPRPPCGERQRLRRRREPGYLISIHAPRVRSDEKYRSDAESRSDFNPRSPGGKRRSRGRPPRSGGPISIHAPRGGRQAQAGGNQHNIKISIHAPVGGATSATRNQSPLPCISIHAPRMGSDQAGWAGPAPWRYFNSRSPYGERLRDSFVSELCDLFQSTLPVGERPSSSARCAT